MDTQEEPDELTVMMNTYHAKRVRLWDIPGTLVLRVSRSRLMMLVELKGPPDVVRGIGRAVRGDVFEIGGAADDAQTPAKAVGEDAVSGVLEVPAGTVIEIERGRGSYRVEDAQGVLTVSPEGRVRLETGRMGATGPEGAGLGSAAGRGADVWTIGYEGHPTAASLTGALAVAGVERLVDVRELPLSRRRGFSKKGLAATLAMAGITYEHARALGNPKAYRELYRQGRQSEGEVGYRAHLRGPGAEALAELAESLGGERTCLMCMEADQARCHRSLIVSELKGMVPGLAVRHL